MSPAIRRGFLALAFVSVNALAALGCSPTLATPSSSSADPASPAAPPGRSPLEAVPEAATSADKPAEQPHAHGQDQGHGQHDHGQHDHGAPLPAASSAKPSAPTATPKNAAAVYACPMHPEVRSNAPGLCPKCNMKLEKQP